MTTSNGASSPTATQEHPRLEQTPRSSAFRARRLIAAAPRASRARHRARRPVDNPQGLPPTAPGGVLLPAKTPIGLEATRELAGAGSSNHPDLDPAIQRPRSSALQGVASVAAGRFLSGSAALAGRTAAAQAHPGAPAPPRPTRRAAIAQSRPLQPPYPTDPSPSAKRSRVFRLPLCTAFQQQLVATRLIDVVPQRCAFRPPTLCRCTAQE